MDWLTSPEALAGLATLLALEIVLGIDNVVFISILADKLLGRFAQREQSILFINRRGYSSSMLCTKCGHVEECTHLFTTAMRCMIWARLPAVRPPASASSTIGAEASVIPN